MCPGSIANQTSWLLALLSLPLWVKIALGPGAPVLGLLPSCMPGHNMNHNTSKIHLGIQDMIMPKRVVVAVHAKKNGLLNLLRFCLVSHLFPTNKLLDVRSSWWMYSEHLFCRGTPPRWRLQTLACFCTGLPRDHVAGTGPVKSSPHRLLQHVSLRKQERGVGAQEENTMLE